MQWRFERSVLVVRLKLAIAAATTAVIAAVALQWGADPEGPSEDGLDSAAQVAAQAMASAGMTVEGDVRLLPLGGATVEDAEALAALAEVTQEGHETHDLARVTIVRAPDGEPVRVGPVFNLTHTANADEQLVAIEGALAILSIRNDRGVIGLEALDFEGESELLTADWAGVDRAKNRVSNWQETGQTEGLGRVRLMLEKPQKELTIKPLGERRFTVQSDAEASWSVFMPPRLEAAPTIETDKGTLALAAEAQVKGQRPHLGWVVDTVRDLSFVGPHKIARLEDIAFDGIDWLKRQRESVFGPAPVEAPQLAATHDDAPETVALANIPTAQGEGWRPSPERTKDRIWPPKSGVPVFETPGPGEGKWVPMNRLIKPAADNAIVFYQSWVRPDPDRGFAHVSTTAWDPSRLELGIVAGTREPESRTGLKGTGRIPRRPEVMPRVVAAFNGGFQSKHGTYGMIEEGAAIAPAMGAAATIVTTRDKRMWMGAWPAVGPHPNPWTRAEGVPVPEWAFGLRQNLDSLVDGGVVNPAGRKKWGSTAGAASEGVHTVRTGLCLLEGGAMAYFYGASVSAEMLGKAMLAFHCQYGMHLDMNSGHSGFEFYNIKDTEGKDFKASRMIKNMWHMNYPRYIKRDARDYMFITHRVLPSERLDNLTGLTWRAPALEGAKATTPPGQPSRILIADVTLDGGASHAELIRLPRAGAAGQRRAFDGDTPPTEATTVLIANLDPIEAPSHHLALSAETFAVQLDAPNDASLPALTLAAAAETLTTTHAIVLAVGKDDILATHARREDLSELGRWFEKKGYKTVHALPCADQSGLALRLVSAKGEEAFRGGPLRSDRPIWTLEIAPAAPFSDRLESHITGPEF